MRERDPALRMTFVAKRDVRVNSDPDAGTTARTVARRAVTQENA